MPILRSQLEFHDHLVGHVLQWQNEIRELNDKNVIFVGVHCRRTDFENHLLAVSGSTMVDHHFYETAFEIYRQKYDDNNNKVVFLAVSDDNKWIKVKEHWIKI